MRLVGINIHDVPKSIRTAVEDDARERDMSVNDVIMEILARRYKRKAHLSGYPFTFTSGAVTWLVRVPEPLRNAIRRHAERDRLTMRGCVLLALAAHYGVEQVSAYSRRIPLSIDPEIVSAARERHAAGESLRSISDDLGIRRPTLTKAIRAAA